MEKKVVKKRKRKSIAVPKKNEMLNLATKAGLVTAGLIAGTQLTKLIAKKDTVSGNDLLGLSGNESAYTANGIVLAAGVAAALLVDNKYVKDASIGLAISGAAGIINKVAGKSIVALGTTENEMPVILPSIAGAGVYPNIAFNENTLGAGVPSGSGLPGFGQNKQPGFAAVEDVAERPIFEMAHPESIRMFN